MQNVRSVKRTGKLIVRSGNVSHHHLHLHQNLNLLLPHHQYNVNPNKLKSMENARIAKLSQERWTAELADLTIAGHFRS